MAIAKNTATRAVKFEIARRLGISRPTLDKYLAEPKAPVPDGEGRYSVSAVKDWIAARKGMRGAGMPKGHHVAKPFEDLRQRKLNAEVEALEQKNRQARGEFVAVKELVPLFAAFNRELTEGLRAKFEFELPSRYRGKNTNECAQLNIEAMDGVLRRLKEAQFAIVKEPIK